MRNIALVLILGLACGLAEVPKLTPQPPTQPTDANIRGITSIAVIHDGDTFTCDMDMIRLGEVHIAANKIRIRLKGVSSYEVNDKDPERRAVAMVERDALAKILLGAKTITVQLFRQTHDRYEGVVWADGVNVNEQMRTYPQGGN